MASRDRAGAQVLVGVWDPSPITSNALVAALSDTGLTAEVVERVESWVSGRGQRLLLLPASSGVDVLRRVQGSRPDLVVVCLVDMATSPQTRDVIAAGTDTVLPRDLEAGELSCAIKIVAEGFSVVPQALALREAGLSRLELSPDEERLFRALAEWRHPSVLRAKLRYSRSAINRHLRALYRTLGVRDREEAIWLAGRLGLGRQESTRQAP